MKSLAALGMLFALNSMGQVLCPPNTTCQNFPAMHKALELENLVKGADKDAVVNMMCAYPVFARGINVLVYMERDSGSCLVTTIFTFLENRCMRLDITMSYEDDRDLQRDARELVDRFNWVYSGNHNMDSATANYKTGENHVSRFLIWDNPSNFLQMSFVERGIAKSIKVIMLYK